MFFSRITLRPGLPLAEITSFAPQSPYDDHRLLWRFFREKESPGAGRFLFRRVEDTKGLRYFVVSPDPPERGELPFCVETKVYDPALQSGRRFRFGLRVNPVVSQRDTEGRLHRHDLVMHLKQQYRKGTLPPPIPPNPELWYRAATGWFEGRSEKNGFRVAADGLSVIRYQTHRFQRPHGERIRFSSLDLEGVLEVTDPVLFRRALFSGIGPAKGFGCGLLMIRPA